MTTKNVLSPEDWITAGFCALKAKGLQGLKVEALARRLGVSKGSFYWHFKNANALEAAMLNFWIERATSSMIDGARSANSSPAEQLRWLVAAIYKTSPSPIVSRDIDENTIRNWSQFNDQANQTVRHVDELRLTFLENLFNQVDANSTSARSNAVILYAAFIGLEQLASTEVTGAKQNLSTLLELLMPDNI